MSLYDPKFIEEFINFFEETEMSLLTWGFYNISYNSSEFEDLFQKNASNDLKQKWNDCKNRHGITLDEFFDDLSHANILYKLINTSNRYRSRFAEGVRLLKNVKQRFSQKDWISANNLVGDLKLNLQKRKYPKFNFEVDYILSELNRNNRLNDIQKQVFLDLSKNAKGDVFKYAGFQFRSFKRILENYNSSNKSPTGTIICAGTGSGKTKSFYIPAFLGVVGEIDRQPFTKVISIYPRNVLLADQLREGISESLKIYKTLTDKNKRPITFGALIGDTPETKNTFDYENSFIRKSWKRHGNEGYEIPFVRSPDEDKRSKLVWLDKDRKNNKSCLRSIDDLHGDPVIPNGVLKLTREDIQKNPPDFLFISLEMFHREISNPRWYKAFGKGKDVPKPRLLLFDEIHNYAGLHGANTPWIIARWKENTFYNEKSNFHVVGLSATLKNAKEHISNVACIKEDRIVEYSPTQDELNIEGREYNILVKGDASSGSSLLGTSIQTALLYTRLQTPRSSEYPQGLSSEIKFLKKTFGFTDQLDSLNRWFSDFTDADRNKKLSKYRDENLISENEIPIHEHAGQIWPISKKLGYDLSQSLRTTRCSSQDPGADNNSDFIIATASLEVGFDDPDVGVVIHHKAPKNISSFIQRKGRAGRTRGSRPTTITVLSDYGRDRWYYQNSDKLFFPQINRINLPMLNPYILKVQATAYLIDWIGNQIRCDVPFRYLRYNTNANQYNGIRLKVINLLKEILEQKGSFYKFKKSLWYLVSSLSQKVTFSDDDINDIVETILWFYPRPLMLHVIPTLLRQLEVNWKKKSKTNDLIEDKNARNPLPKYLPSASFMDLEISEIEVLFPNNPNKDTESRSISSQLYESCPGRVSKRFSTAVGEVGYWLKGSEIFLTSHDKRIKITNFFSNFTHISSKNNLNIYQPNEFELYQRPKQVVDSSNSNWIWKTFFAYEGAGKDLKIFNNMNWKNIFHETKRFLHKEQNHINVLRSSSEGEYNILQGRSEIQGTFNLVDDSDNECSIGFEMNVDGVLFKINEDHLNKINFSELNKDTQMRLKFEYFSYQLQNSSKLKEIANKFTIDWIHKTSVSMLTAVALKKKIKLHESQSYLDDVRVEAAIKVIKSMYSSDLVQSDDEIAPETKLEKKMTDIWSNNILVTEIKHLENVLWDDLNNENFNQWLKEKYVKSLSEGLLKSFQLLMQDFVDDEVDVDSFVDETGTYILLTENSPGGIGFIEEFVKRVQVDEKSFQKGILFSFEHCEKEYFSNSILKLLKESKEEEIKDLFKKFRTSKTHNEYDKCKDLLIETLKTLSIENSQDLVTFVTSKLFQNIFNKDLNLGNIYDKWVLGINKFKTNKEKQLKIPINENIFVYFLSTLKPVQSKLKRWMNEISSDPLNEAQVYSILNNLIISNCHDTCPQCLVNSNKFNFDLSPSRELALEFLTKDFKKDKKINFEDNWIETFKSELVSSSQVTLVVSEDKLENLSFAMQNMLTEPIEKDYLFLYPTIESFSKKADDYYFKFYLRGSDSVIDEYYK